MKIIDTHTHAWGAPTDELPWQAEVLPPGWTGPYAHHDLVADMDSAGISEAVVVTTPLYGRSEQANEYTMRSIEAHPDRLYGVGLMDFFQADADTVVASLERVTGHPRMLGVRMHAALEYEAVPTVLDRHGDWILDDRLDPVWRAIGDLDACLFVFPKAQQLEQLATLADRYPETTIVVDHMAWPDGTTSPNEKPWTTFSELAERDNVYAKVSSVPRSADEPWPYEDTHGYVTNLVDWFGPERLLLGSDYPWMDQWAAYDDCLSWLETVETLSRRDRAFISHRTFERLHG